MIIGAQSSVYERPTAAIRWTALTPTIVANDYARAPRDRLRRQASRREQREHSVRRHSFSGSGFMFGRTGAGTVMSQIVTTQRVFPNGNRA